MARYQFLTPVVLLSLVAAVCDGYKAPGADSSAQRIVCIGQAYNEMIYALGAQATLVGVYYSSNYPPEIGKLPTVGYHRALSAEGILSLHPTLIFLDEPLTFLDIRHQLDFMAKVRTFASQRDVIVVGVVHDLSLAAQFADRLILLHQGRVVADGSTRDVLTEACSRSARGIRCDAAGRVLAARSALQGVALFLHI